MGYKPRAIPLIHEGSDVPTASERLKWLNTTRAEALAAHELARQQMAERVMRNFTPLKEGDKVWLEAKNLNTGLPYRKLKPKREGPFKVEKVLSPWTYRLELPFQWRVHPVFHASLLTPYQENETHGPNHLKPPPDLIAGENEFEVEAILAHRGRGRRRRYLVKWKDYPSADNTWEPEEALEHAQETLTAYKKRRTLP